MSKATILAYVQNHPGCTMREISKHVKSRSHTGRALSNLKRTEQVYESRLGNWLTMWWDHQPTDAETRQAMLNRWGEYTRAVYAWIEKNPGAFCAEIARRLPAIQPGTVQTAIVRLERYGFVRREKPGKLARFYAVGLDAPVFVTNCAGVVDFSGAGKFGVVVGGPEHP